MTLWWWLWPLIRDAFAAIIKFCEGVGSVTDRFEKARLELHWQAQALGA